MRRGEEGRDKGGERRGGRVIKESTLMGGTGIENGDLGKLHYYTQCEGKLYVMYRK